MKRITIIASIFLLLLCSCTSTHRTELEEAQLNTSDGKSDQQKGNRITLHNTAANKSLSDIIDKKMDQYDHQQLSNIYDTGVSDKSSAWINPDTRNQYTVTPHPHYEKPNRQVCRKAQIEARIDEKSIVTQTTACKTAGGSWHLQ